MPYQRTTRLDRCAECEQSFHPLNGNHVYCSKQCNSRATARRYERFAQHPVAVIPKGTIGAISELRVSADLMARGYHVFRAMSPACPGDLMVFKGEQSPILVEVRTGQRSPTTGRVSYAKLRANQTTVGLIAVVLFDRILYEPNLDDDS